MPAHDPQTLDFPSVRARSPSIEARGGRGMALKVVDVAGSYSEQGGGIRTYVQHKLQAAARLGHEVVVVAPGVTNREQKHAGGKIVWLESPRSPVDSRYGMFVDEKAIHAVLEREQPDVVEGSSPWTSGKAVASWTGRAKKSFVFHTDAVAVWPQTFLGHWLGFDRIDRWSRPFWRRLASLAAQYDATVVSGEWLARRVSRFGIDNAVVVPFGIDKAQFSPTKRCPQTRARMLEACGLGADASLVVVVSRLDPEKRIGTLLRAFRRASRTRELGLVVFGGGSLRGLYRFVGSRVPGVHFAGFVNGRDEMATMLASADVLLHGSAAETYGLGVAEAVCSGVPVVVPHLGGAAEFGDPSMAEVYRAGDVEDCAAALLRLLARDRTSTSLACATVAARISSVDRHFDALFAFYRGICHPRASNDAHAANAGTSSMTSDRLTAP